ncbi:restriction endonuclease subunit S [Enterococcus faecium]|uniref:restriction endonuclease subunit S n=1 Tax=Enterococcus faecium TaxID=1352 RepID=UPI001116883A|nr:restriction endonuclease subunit S [Enterococcus faecium]MDT2338470.1 restriction endonuclease subunit S [Enterococcus faecium]QDA51470.1 restriction endonuclease subunit S [Enterococcus faecium]WOV58573.1 restriction endonuclease subunit S [Enterococcus faecium]
MSNNTQPEIRFPGFTEDWEQRKLGDFIDVKSGKDYKHLNSGSIPVYGTGGYMLSVDRALSDIDAIGIGRKGTIDKPYLLKAPFWTVDTLFYAVPKQNIDLQFSLSIFKKINWKKFDESTGVPSLSKTVINSVGASVPSYEEQQKIGSFFKQLDETIALHQRKLDLLKETKKGFLQKMFPKNGAKVPEIRFPGFTKDWEERKLGDVFSERSERSSEGELISVTINSGVIKASELDRKDNSSDNKSNYKKVEVGDIAYNSMRMWQGASGYSSYEGILSPAYTVIIPKEGTDSKFFAYDFKRYDMIQTFKRNSQGLTSDTWNLKFPTLKLVKIMVPSIEEQKQIAAFFERLDNTIALHERELDVLKETKKGFLQKMFV